MVEGLRQNSSVALGKREIAGDALKSTALPSWCYRNPEDIADGLIARTARQEKADKRKAELHILHRRRRIKALVRLAKQGKLHGKN